MGWLVYNPEGFDLHAGGRSNWLIDAQAAYEDGPLRAAVISYWLRCIEEAELGPPFELIYIPRGGKPWAIELARALAKRETQTAVSPPKLAVSHAATYILVDDVITTGISMDVADLELGKRDIHIDHRLAVFSRHPSPIMPMTDVWAWLALP